MLDYIKNQNIICSILLGTSTFLLYSLNWEIQGLSLDENTMDVPVLTPVSSISMASVVDFFERMYEYIDFILFEKKK